MPLWKKLWLLFTVIWLTVAGLQVATILAFAEGEERQKAVYPIIWGIAVPAVIYALVWAWVRWTRKS